MSWKTIPGIEDTVADLSYGPNHTLASVSWDGRLTTWDCDTGSEFHVVMDTPLFAVCWQPVSFSQVYIGGASRRISVVDLTSGRVRDVGIDHTAAVSCIIPAASNAIFAGSYDRSIELLDIKSGKSITYDTPDKILDMDMNTTYQLVAACSGCRVRIYDTRNMGRPVETRQMHGSYPLRRIRCMPSGEGYAVTNIQSRVTVEYFWDSKKNFVFRSNRNRIHDPPGWEAHSLNALAFSPREPSQLLVGGSDKQAFLWDFKKRKLISRYQLPQSITSLAFSKDGRYLACGVTDDEWRLMPSKAAQKSNS